MALQQPNFPALAQHLAGVVNEVQFIQNAPIANMANIPNQLAQMQQQLAQIQQAQQQMQQTQQQMQQTQQQMQQTQQQMQQTQQQMRQQIDRVQEQLNQSEMLSPIRFHNSIASLTAPLVFPPLPQGVNLPANHPNTKTDLMYMDVQTCQALANTFGLPALPAGAPVQLLRQQIMNHLGAMAA